MIATPANEASKIALQIYEDVLDRLRADHLVADAVERLGDQLFIQGHHIHLNEFENIYVCGAGKASVAMATALLPILGDKVSGGLIVTKFGLSVPVTGLEVFAGSHPVPDQNSLEAGEKMHQFAQERKEGDLVIFLLSGGASSLMEVLVDGVSLEDLQRTTEFLLESGASIQTINAVRKQLSKIKGGALAEAFAPATVVCLVLSDVVGNDLTSVGSGPLLPQRSSKVSPLLQTLHWNEKLPESVRTVLASSPQETPSVPPVPHYVIGSVSLAMQAIADSCTLLGLPAYGFSDPLLGEAREMSSKIMDVAKRHMKNQPDSPWCLYLGGETTVTIHGTGLGGRCQEMAVAAATTMQSLEHSAFLVAGTDGNDGPTIAAGGIVDPKSVARARAKGQTTRGALKNNDSFHFLEACGGLIVTGPTNTNVNDIAIFIHLPS